jgi:hypothetical protein
MDRAATATTGTQMDRASTASAGTQTVRRATATGSPLVVKLDKDGKFVGIEGQLQIDPTTGKPVYDEYASIVESRDLPPPPATWGQTIRRGLGFSVPQPIKQTVTQTQTPFQQSELESLGIRESDFQSAPQMAARPTTIRNPGTQTGRVVFATPRRASTVPPDSAVPNHPAARRGLF